MSKYILSEDLAVWFGDKKKKKGSSQPKGPWVNICKKKKGGGHPPCGRKDADKGGYPVCRGAGVAGKMSQKDKDSACRRKREKEKKDTQTGKGQKPTRIKVKNYKKESTRELTHMVMESIVGDSILCDNCGWKWKIKDGGDDLYVCHKCWNDNTPEDSDSEVKLIEGLLHSYSNTKETISEDMRYHMDNNIPLSENIFRTGSPKYFEVINEARKLRELGLYENELDDELLNGDLGKFFIYEGNRLPLDFPMVNEQGADTSWSRDEDKITLKDILELTKDIKVTNFPTKKLANVVLNWDGNPEEIDRISQVEVSSQYPILIMVDENNKIQWILDGNHRAHKALRSNSETIPAKLIKPSNLNPKSKKIFGIYEAEYKGKDVDLNKPKSGGPKKWYVYVKNPKTGKVKKVSYGSPDMTAKWNDPERRKSFAARHQCAKKKDKTKAGYWACRAHKDFGNNVSGRFW